MTSMMYDGGRGDGGYSQGGYSQPGLVNSGLSVRGGRGRRPRPRPQMFQPPSPDPMMDGNGNVSPFPQPARPTPLPVGNGITPYSPTGLNFGPGRDLQSSVIGGTKREYAPLATQRDYGTIGGAKRDYGAVGPVNVDPRTIGGNRQYGAIGGRRDYGEVAAQDTDRLGLARGMRDDFTSYLSTPDLQAGAAINPTDDPRLAAARARTDSSLNAVGGVDRRQLAKDILADFNRSNVDANREDYRQVGQQAGSLGRLGMGQTAQDIQEVGRKHLTDRASLETRLAEQTAAGEISDRMDRANLSRGVEGDIFGQGQATRQELRGERGYATDIASQNRNALMEAKRTGLNLADQAAGNRINDLSNFRTEQRGERAFRVNQDQANDDNQRTERGFQVGVDQANDDALRGERAFQYNAAQARNAELRGERGFQVGQDQAYDDSLRTERGFRANADQAYDAQRQHDRAFQYGADQDFDNSQRTERGYQTGRAEAAIDRNVQQVQLEEAIRNGTFNRGLSLSELAYRGNPALNQLAQANVDDAGAQDQYSSIAQLLKMYGLNSAGAR